MSVVAGPNEASCTTLALPWVQPTTVVSTRLSNGSLNQISTVVAQNLRSFPYDGTLSDIVLLVKCSLSCTSRLMGPRTSLDRRDDVPAGFEPPCPATSPDVSEDCCRGVREGDEAAVADCLEEAPNGAFHDESGLLAAADNEVDSLAVLVA